MTFSQQNTENNSLQQLVCLVTAVESVAVMSKQENNMVISCQNWSPAVPVPAWTDRSNDLNTQRIAHSTSSNSSDNSISMQPEGTHQGFPKGTTHSEGTLIHSAPAVHGYGQGYGVGMALAPPKAITNVALRRREERARAKQKSVDQLKALQREMESGVPGAEERLADFMKVTEQRRQKEKQQACVRKARQRQRDAQKMFSYQGNAASIGSEQVQRHLMGLGYDTKGLPQMVVHAQQFDPHLNQRTFIHPHQQVPNCNISMPEVITWNNNMDVISRMRSLETELKMAREKVRLLEEEIELTRKSCRNAGMQ